MEELDKKINVALNTSDVVKKIIELFGIPENKIENGKTKINNPWFYIRILPGIYSHYYPKETNSQILSYFLGFYQEGDNEICLIQIKFTNYSEIYGIESNFPNRIKEDECIKILQKIVFNNDAVLVTEINNDNLWAVFDIENYIKL